MGVKQSPPDFGMGRFIPTRLLIGVRGRGGGESYAEKHKQGQCLHALSDRGVRLEVQTALMREHDASRIGRMPTASGSAFT